MKKFTMLLAMLFLLHFAFSQGTETLTITVRSETTSGAIIPNALVHLATTTTGVTLPADQTTNASGQVTFTVPTLAAAASTNYYYINTTISATGFLTRTQSSAVYVPSTNAGTTQNSTLNIFLLQETIYIYLKKDATTGVGVAGVPVTVVNSPNYPQQILTTDATGRIQITANRTASAYNLTVTANPAGYTAINTTQSVSPTTASPVTTNIALYWLYTLNFKVTDINNNPIANATVNTTTGVPTTTAKTTDVNGAVSFIKNKSTSTINYSVTNVTGFCDTTLAVITSSLITADPYTVPTMKLKNGYDINFKIQDINSVGIVGTSIVIKGPQGTSTITSGAGGLISFTKKPNGNYYYTITKTGYVDKLGVLTISGATLNPVITLNSGMDFTFTVKRGTANLSNDSITVNGVTKVTNASGVAIFGLPLGTNTFINKKYAFVGMNGTINVDPTITKDTLTLRPTPIYSMLINVQYYTGPQSASNLVGANVLFNGKVYITDASGNVYINPVAPIINSNPAKQWYYIKVYKDGYADYTDSVNCGLGVPATNQSFNSTTNKFSIYPAMSKPRIDVSFDANYNATFILYGSNNIGVDHSADVNYGVQGGQPIFGDVPNTMTGVTPDSYKYYATILPANSNYTAARGRVTVGPKTNGKVNFAFAKGYQLTVNVLDNPIARNPISGAIVYAADTIVNTPDNGIADFKTQYAGIYPYSVILKNTNGVIIGRAKGSVQIATTANSDIAYIQPVYNVNFQVFDNLGNGISGATVTADNVSVTTNFDGKAVIPCITGTTSYTVTPPTTDYLSTGGTVTINNAVASVNITLTKAASLSFTITDGVNPLPGAFVTVGSQNLTTNSLGQVSFVKTLAVNTPYSCVVSAYGFADSVFTETLTSDLVVPTIALKKANKIIFRVFNTLGVILKNDTYNTSFTFNGKTVTSDIIGQYTAGVFPNGTYSYSVSAPGYLTNAGSVTVNGADINQTIYLSTVNYVSSAVNVATPNTISLVFTGNVLCTSTAGLTVKVNGTTNAITSFSGSGTNTLTLALTTAITDHQSVTLQNVKTLGNLTDINAMLIDNFGPVNVTNAIKNTQKNILTYSFLKANNPSLTADIVGTIGTNTIDVTIPFGANNLIATFTYSTYAQSVLIGTAVQVSGSTSNDFSNAITYTVTAEDYSTNNYTMVMHNTYTAPYSQSFDGTTFPPMDWVIFNAGTGGNFTRNTTSTDAGAGAMWYQTNGNLANAWAFAPNVNMISGKKYALDFYQKVNSATAPEKLKVTIGQAQTVAAQTTVLWNNAGGASLTNTTYVKQTALYNCATSGVYNFAFNCYSDATSQNLFIDEVMIRQLSSNASLATLSVTEGALVPAFSPTVLSYVVNLPSNATTTTINATLADGTASKVTNPATNLNGITSARTATITVTAEDGTVVTYSILFNRPTYAVNLSSKDFSGTAIGATSAAQNFSITNTGTGNLNIQSVTLTGANASEFILSDANTYPSAITTGSLSINVQIKPTTSGNKTATLNIIEAGNATPYTIALTAYIKNNNATLSALSVTEGTLVPAYSTTVLQYSVNVPCPVTSPTINATTADINASNIITAATNLLGASADRTAKIVVTAEDGTVLTYNIVFLTQATVQASNLNFTNISYNSATINWTSGNGLKRVVFVKEGTTAPANGPATGTLFTASADWSAKGTELSSGSGYFCVYDGTGNSVSLTNLSTATNYTAEVFEYNATPSAELYMQSTATNNPNTFATLKISQTITFGTLVTKTYGDAGFDLSATTTSGLAITYTSSNTSVATINGKTVTIVGAGSTTITASQAGNSLCLPATPVQQTLTVNKANQSIIFGTLNPVAYGNSNLNLTAIATSGLPVTYISSNTSVATINGNTVTIVSPGATTITASQAGNSNYNAASDILQTLPVNKANQTITFTSLSDKTFGDANFTLTATASTGFAITYVSSDPSVATINGNIVTITGAGSVAITASQAGDNNYNAAPTALQIQNVNKANQTIIFNTLAAKTYNDAPFNLTATSSSNLPVSYTSSNLNVATINGSTVTIVGGGITTITAIQNGNRNYNGATNVQQTLTVNKASQTINFGALANKAINDAAFNLSATATSGLPVTYTSSDPTIATINGNFVTIIGIGTTTITATQAGNDNYSAATNVQQSLRITKLNQTITFGALSAKTYGDAAFNLTASSSSTLPVTYTSSNTVVATINGNTINIVGAGQTTITASQVGGVNYEPATDVPQTLTVNKANQTITFVALAAKTFGDASFNLTANATSGLTITFASSDATVATVNGNVVTITGAGSATITASQSGNNNYNSATNVIQTLTVGKANQTITFNTLVAKTYGDAPFTISATATSNGTMTYVSSNPNVATINGNTVTIVNAGTTVITASQNGTVNYNAAQNVTQSLTVNKADQSITFNALPSKTFGDAPYNITATSTSGLPVSFSSANTGVAAVNGSMVTIIGVGTTTITAAQQGNSNYNAAAITIPQTLTVVKANQSISFGTLVGKLYNDLPFDLTASATSNLAVTYTSSNPTVATISGKTVTIYGSGSTIITASQSGNGFYNAASDVQQTLNVRNANQTITFGALTAKTYGDAAFNLTATATSNMPLTYASSNTSVATINGTTVTIVGAGTTTITASQAGNSYFNSATDVPQTLIVNKANQTIIFNAMGVKSFGDAAFNLSASTSSNATVAYTSSNPAVATISGNMVTITGAGTTTITASQTGDANYNAAADVQQTLTVVKENQTISYDIIPSKIYGDATFAVNAISTSGLPITYTSSNTAVALVNGNIVTIVGVGVSSITAWQQGNSYYNAATPVQQSAIVYKASQAITFANAITKTYGDATFDLSATTTSNLPLNYTSSNTAVATVNGKTVTIVGAGTTTIAATQAGSDLYLAAKTVSQTLTVNKADQTIAFDALNANTYGDAAFNLTAPASSGLPVNFVSSNPNVATINGSSVTIVGTGTTTIYASQAGNDNYNALEVSQTLTVNKANQTITFDALNAKTFGDANFNLTATASTGLQVTYASSNPAVATVNGNTVTIVGVGTTTITASQAGNNLYNAATDAQQTLTVNKANQTLSFGTLSAKTFGDASFTLTATSTTTLPVNFVSSNTAVATVSGNTVTIVGSGTTTITASQAGNGLYNDATNVDQTLTVFKANQTISFDLPSVKTYGDASFTLNGTTSTGLPVIYSTTNTDVITINGNTVTIVGIGSANIIASQSGNANYSAATNVSRQMIVNMANQKITFAPLQTKTYGDATFNLTASASSQLPVSFVSSNTAVATVAGNTVTIIGAGTTTITASQTGNANYNAAYNLPQTLTVNKANQSVTFGALDAKTLGDASFNLTATSTSGLNVTFASSNPNVATINGTTVMIVGAGTTTITASQTGNSNYNASVDVAQSLTVNKANQTITFGALAANTFGDASFYLTASVSSNLAVSYTSSNPAVATVNGNAVTIVGAGTTTITALQTGNTNYNAAANVSQTLTVNKANQMISFGALSPKTFGDATFNLSATATSDLNVTYSSSNTAVASVNGNQVTIVGGGTAIITASQAGNSNYNAATGVPQSLTVNKASQSISFGSLSAKTFGDAAFNLAATSTSGLAVNYTSSNQQVATVSGNTVTIVGAGTTTIAAVQSGNSNYNAATNVQQTLVVNAANQTISFGTLVSKTFGDAAFNLTATSTSGLPITFVSSNNSVATISGNTVTIVGAGSVTISAIQAGNTNYNATYTAQDLFVNKANQTVTFNAMTAKIFGDASFDLTATASSSLPVTYTSSNQTVATVNGKTVTIVGAGTTTITATQVGSSNYNAASGVQQTLNVNKANQTIMFNTLPSKAYGDASFNLTATALSGGNVTYTSSNTAVATVSGNVVSIIGIGNTNIVASQSGNANYNAATDVPQTLTVTKASQSITFGTLEVKTFGDAAFNLNATSVSGLPVTYASSNTAVATVNGNTITIVGAGTATITASQNGNNYYNAAANVQQTLTINKANQLVYFEVTQLHSAGDPAFNLYATATSGLAVTFTSSNPNVATINGSTITLVGSGTVTITATQAGNSNYNPISISQTLTVTPKVSVNEISAKAINVYPIPASNEVTIDLGTQFSAGNLVKIVDFSGRTMKQFEMTNAVQQVNVSSLSAGVYFIQFRLNGALVVKKIIIQ